MTPPKRNQRLKTIGFSAITLVIGAALLFSALSENTQFFYDPSDIASDGFTPKSDQIRIGGLVVVGSIEKGEGLNTEFSVKDFEGPSQELINVSYDGIMPDLFREGQGVVITGSVTSHATIRATEVLAKHDENYRPKT